MADNTVIPIVEEIYEMLPQISIEFINMIIDFHNSYTNLKHSDIGLHSFLYELMSDILNNKITKDDEKMLWLVNQINEMGIKNTTEFYFNLIKNNTDYELLCYQIDAIDDALEKVLYKYGLISV